MGFQLETQLTAVGADPGLLLALTTAAVGVPSDGDFYLRIKNNAGDAGVSAYITQATTEDGPNSLECPSGGKITTMGPFDAKQIAGLYLWSSGSPSCAIQCLRGPKTNALFTCTTVDAPTTVDASAIKKWTSTVDTSDLTAGAGNQEVTLLDDAGLGFPKNSVIVGAYFEVDVLFGGGAVSDCTATLGDTGDPNGLILAVDVFTDSATGTGRQFSNGVQIDNENLPFEAAFLPVCDITTTGANVTALTAGSLVVHVWYMDVEVAAPSSTTTGGAVQEWTSTVDIGDLTAAAVSQEVTLLDDDGAGFPANACIMGAWLEVDELFGGGAVSDCTVSVGDTAATTQLILAVDVFTDSTKGRQFSNGALIDNENLPYEAAYLPVADVTCTGANVTACLTGSLVIHIWYIVAELS